MVESGVFVAAVPKSPSTGLGRPTLLAGARLAALTAPAQLTVSSSTPTSANLTWTLTPGATGYRIERAAATGSFAIVATLTDVSTYTDSGLTTNVSYRYRVSAMGSDGTSEPSPVASITPVVASNLAAPTDLTATQANASMVTLNWANTTSDQAVLVQRSLNGGLTWTNLVTLTGATKTYNDSVSRATLYAYRLQTSTFSAVSPFTGSVALLTPPPDVTSFFRTAISQTSATFTWTAVLGATGYVIEQSKELGTYSTVATLAGGVTTTTVPDLESGTQYQYRIRATNAGGNSNPRQLTGVLTIPADPGLLTLAYETPDGTPGIRVSFTAIKGAAKYVLERQSDGRSWAKLAEPQGSATSYFDTLITSGESYDYRLKAVNEAGESDFSPVSSTFITDSGVLPAPSNLTFVADSKGLITLSWTSAAPPSAFVVQRLQGTTWRPLVTVPGTVTSAVLKGLPVGSATRVRVAAIPDSGGDGVASEDIPVVLPPAQVKALKVLGTPTSSSVTLTWTAPPSSTKYRVERSSDGKIFTPLATDLTAAIFQDTTLAPGTSYTYRIAAGNAGGFGLSSANFFVSTAPLTPSGVSVSPLATGSFTVRWGDVTGETGYRVQGSADGIKWTVLATTKPNVTTATVKSKTAQFFRVAAFNKAGNSNFSAPMQAVAVTPAPTNLLATGFRSGLFSDAFIRNPAANPQTLV